MERVKIIKNIKTGGIILTIAVIIYIFWYQMSASKKLLENEREDLQEQIIQLNSELNKIRGISLRTRVTKDSLYNVLRPYLPYEAMVKSSAQRDSIASLLPFKYGDLVFILPDSLKGIIEGIVYGGNQFESYVKYKVLMKNNKYVEVNPTQLKSTTK